MQVASVSRSWSPAAIVRAGADLNASHTPDSMATWLSNALTAAGGHHLLALLYVLDACMKQSSKLVGAIGATLTRLLRVPLPFSKQQSQSEREWMSWKVHTLVQHWGLLKLVGPELSGTVFHTGHVNERQGYFWKAGQSARALRQLRGFLQPRPLDTPVFTEDPRTCAVCAQSLDVYFHDANNWWAYSDAHRMEDDTLVHVLCNPVEFAK